MFCRFDGFHHSCESELCADCSVFLQWEESMRNVREIKWFDPKEVLPSNDDNVLAIVSCEYEGTIFDKYYFIVYYCSDKDRWYSDENPQFDLKVHWWCELPDAPEEKGS